MSTPLVWFITGTSTGIGRELALAALAHGDKVIATARGSSLSKLEDLKAKGADTLELDVTASLDTIRDVAKKAVDIHGRIDVVVNNAGRLASGVFEEITTEEVFASFNTNLFGGMNVAKAFLPYMREKNSGTVMWIGSVNSWWGPPYASIYSATKWALRGISECLHTEISMFGLRSICFDFGAFRTPFMKEELRHIAPVSIPSYQEFSKMVEAHVQGMDGNQLGDPTVAAKAIVDVAHGTGVAAGKTIPTSINFGSDSYEMAKKQCEKALNRLEEWKDVSISTDFPGHEVPVYA